MKPETLAAVAAVVAAIASIANILVSTYSVRNQETTKWARNMLPDTALKLDGVFGDHISELMNTQWESLAPDARETVGMEHFKDANKIIDRMSLFAAPETVRNAYAVLYVLDEWRMVGNSEHSAARKDLPWGFYWQASDATYEFTKSARAEMGLKPLAVPPGLAKRRKRERKQ